LREGIPRAQFALWEQKVADIRRLSKASGDDYLNLKFGWEPLVRDIQQSFQQVLNADRIVAQLERDAGRVVRRRFAFPDERSTSINSFSHLFALLWAQQYESGTVGH